MTYVYIYIYYIYIYTYILYIYIYIIYIYIIIYNIYIYVYTHRICNPYSFLLYPWSECPWMPLNARVWSGSRLWPGQLELFMWLAKSSMVGGGWSKDLVRSQQTAPGSARLVLAVRSLCHVSSELQQHTPIWENIDSAAFFGGLGVNLVSGMWGWYAVGNGTVERQTWTSLGC